MTTPSVAAFHSQHLFFKTPFGAVAKDEPVRLRLAAPKKQGLSCYLNYYRESPEGKCIQSLLMTPMDEGFEASFIPRQTGLYFYWFSLDEEGRVTYLGAPADGLSGQGVLYEFEAGLTPYQITVHEYLTPAPAWYREAIFYQIFPDRFCNGDPQGRVLNPKPESFLYATWADAPYYIRNETGAIERWDFAGGNLLGIEKKLPYLKSLGITGLYLNPIFEARSNHRYDTADYHRIDPVLGGDGAFDRLMEATQEAGIGLILDGVFNHTGADSRYFNARGTYGPKRAKDPDSCCHDWFTFREDGSYDCWWGVTDLPTVNKQSASYQEFLFNAEDGVVGYWLNKGAMGWRLDVADELPDAMIERIRGVMDQEGAPKDRVLIGEVWEDASNKISYGQRRAYLLGKELHGVMNYPLKKALLGYLKGETSAQQTERIFWSLKENYPPNALYAALNFLGTHDTPRIREELKNDDLLGMAVKLLFTLPGVPCIYYGDEAGLYGAKDPYNRATFPWGREDLTVFQHYEEAIALRRSSKAFIHGSFLPFSKGKCFGFWRSLGEELWLVAANREQTSESLHIVPPGCESAWTFEVPPRQILCQRVDKDSPRS
ncbi:Neopullulanase [Clostridiaceae bacterium JG1575]|nr:Neopullulanase [Clostridiaceae bacterium JG1575]